MAQRPERVRGSVLAASRVPVSPLSGIDSLLVGSLLLLCGLGVLNLLSLGETASALHQAASAGLGCIAMLLALRSGARPWRLLGRAIYALAVLLLGATALAGAHAFGAQRWLAIGAVVFQPSELAKLGELLMLAQVLSQPRSRHRLLLALGVAALPIALTLLEPDLSTALLLAIVAAAMIVLARIRLRSLALVGAAVGLCIPAALRLLRPYQVARLQTFLDGGANAQGAGWTQLQAHIAVASGGLLGAVTPIPTQLLAQYLPARDTDLAFASLVEQHGFIAGAAVLLAGAVIVWRLIAAAGRTRTSAGSLVAAGLATLLGSEIAINVAGNLGLLPLAGVPFPLVSFGGTAVVAHFAAAGVVMAERRDEVRRRLWLPPRRLRSRPRAARLTALGLAAALFGLAAATFSLQRNDANEFTRAALEQATRTIVIPGGRGAITDRHGTLLAYDLPVQQVLAVPSIVAQDAAAPTILARLLGEPVAAVQRSLASPPPYEGYDVVLSGAVNDATAAAVEKAAIPGVLVTPAVERVYPYGALLAPILGFSGVPTAQDIATMGPLPPNEIVGRAGLELEYDSLLRGGDGAQTLLVDPTGTPVAMGTYSPPAPAGDLRLSLDIGLQEAATQALATALKGVGHGQPVGDEGSITVMDPRSGQILAMASLPAYNDQAFGPPVQPQALNDVLNSGDPYLEHATQTVMPPGSTFKLVVAAADLASGAVPAGEVIPTGGSFSFDGTTMVNWAALPPQDLPEAVAWSNDVYFYKLALALGPGVIDRTGAELGVGRPTGIDLPGEASGVLGSPQSVAAEGSQWYPGTTAMFGIGQGPVAVTPLQVARWTAASATGVLVTPRLALATSVAPGSPYVALQPPTSAALPFAAALGPLQDGLREAVTDGTGTLLDVLPQPAAGKTGTAQDPNAPDGGPDAWYTAYSPAGAPQVVVTVNVRGGGEGAWTAEPAAVSVLRYFDAHAAQILSQAPAVTPNAGRVTGAPGSSEGGAAAVLALPLSGLRTLRRRQAGAGSRRLPLRRRSEDGASSAPESRKRPPAAARSPAGAIHRRRRARHPA